MKKIICLIFILAGLEGVHVLAGTLYVDNIKGNDLNNGRQTSANDGGSCGPVASLERALALLQTSDRIEVMNTGKPYQRQYPGTQGVAYGVNVGGTVDAPVVIHGNGAVLSGLSVIPAEKWTAESGDIYSLPFWPMSNRYKLCKEQNDWLDGTPIWWVDGLAAANCKSMEELSKTANGFWWNKSEKKVLFHLPDGKRIQDLKVEIPATAGIYISANHVMVKDFSVIFSWDDGFDAFGASKNIVFKNCFAYNNCGQGFSCHGESCVYYEDCSAIRCASSGSCDVNGSNSTYKRCLFVHNTYEAGVYAHNDSIHHYEDCLIVGNSPFEQVWQLAHSKLNFYNCVFSGIPTQDILKLESGSVCFKRCTIVDAKAVCAIPENGPGSIHMENCALARCEKYFFKIPKNPDGRVVMTGNLYADGPGHYVGEELYGKKNWSDYLKAAPERASEWKKVKFGGSLNSELAETVKLMGSDRSEKPVGARLPPAVWERYFQLVKENVTPCGVIKND
ncbi:MAG: right-handed parallel beta-helix repeat-containing protein [Verrucomicrobiae bacterium]|nr:right-handed parallel beta-helix repeat-containing protein [Verrucomicrobiae bacterium]